MGSKEDGESHFASILESLGEKELGNPDFFGYRVKSFDIESAREVSERAREKPFGERRIFLISAERFGREAQNALLKTFEDPSPNVHFFIILSAPDLLLPTLLSRLQIIRLKQENDGCVGPATTQTRVKQSNFTVSGEDFLKFNIKDRLKFAEKFEDSLPTFLDSLMSLIRANGSNTKSLDKIFTVRRFADDPSAQPRLILEHLALTLD